MKKYINDNTDANNINKDSFVVVSDFHGFDYPLEIIKKCYLNKYDVIFILGDATDRGVDGMGTGSIKILIDIMRLSKKYPNRVKYLPGNHDEFLLGYIRIKHNIDTYEPYSYYETLVRNGGAMVIKELEYLEQNDFNTYMELINWLMVQPLQYTHTYKGRDYVLGHAIFNQYLYNINPNYSLQDYFNEDEDSPLRRMAWEVLWFRKNKNQYNVYEMPSSNKTMVIGHTPQKVIGSVNNNLYSSDGRVVEVHCVDGGIAYEGEMHEYTGGNTVTKASVNEIKNTIYDKELIFQDYILNQVFSKGLYGAYLYDGVPSSLTYNDISSIVCKNNNIDINYAYSLYVNTLLLNYILESQIERLMQKGYNLNYAIYCASELTRRYIFDDNNLLNITSYRNARTLANILGYNKMAQTIYMNKCNNIEEYINKYILNKQNKIRTRNNL